MDRELMSWVGNLEIPMKHSFSHETEQNISHDLLSLHFRGLCE